MKPQGTEARVCEDIARRQAAGIEKYGTTVEYSDNTFRDWLQHAYEEALDFAVYLKRAIEKLDDSSSAPCQMPCHRCIDDFDIRAPHMPKFRFDFMKMILCEKCGNKRCPHASDHRLACNSSNDPMTDPGRK